MGSDVLFKSPCCKSEKYSNVYEFTCLIKSHAEYPDLEESVTATNKDEAVEKFYKMLREEYAKVDLHNLYVDEGVATEFCKCECGKVFKERDLVEEVIDYNDEEKPSSNSEDITLEGR